MQAGGDQGAGRKVPEQELWTGSYCPKAMTSAFVGAGLLTIVGIIAASFTGPVGWTVVGIGAVVLFGYLGLLLLYRRLSKSYRLTTQRLLRDTGILSRTGDHLLVVNIDDVAVRQNIFDRMFNVGTIYLDTKDKSTEHESAGRFIMSGIENPRHVADLIDEVRRTERNRRALYTVDA
jgi:uncharacterized membrane protein YdbT with pleckstrin-like domain